MDIMVALGEYVHGRFELPGLNMTLNYNPGCLIAFSGKLQHGANCLRGQCVWLAFYMGDQEYDLLSSSDVGHMNIHAFQE